MYIVYRTVKLTESDCQPSIRGW